MDWNELIAAACMSRIHAYAPYSGFAVGAAVLADNGQLYAGCNVENASYGLGNCAERTAVFNMVAGGGKRIAAMAVIASGDRAVAPCGACRQVLTEFADADTPVMLANLTGQTKLVTIGELLPYAFEKGDLPS